MEKSELNVEKVQRHLQRDMDRLVQRCKEAGLNTRVSYTDEYGGSQSVTLTGSDSVRVEKGAGSASDYGYHVTPIIRGEAGEISKIEEEVYELVDADLQNNNIMVMVELSDIIAAIECYIEKHHPSIDLEDLIVMARATERSFRNGKRTSN